MSVSVHAGLEQADDVFAAFRRGLGGWTDEVGLGLVPDVAADRDQFPLMTRLSNESMEVMVSPSARCRHSLTALLADVPRQLKEEP